MMQYCKLMKSDHDDSFKLQFQLTASCTHNELQMLGKLQDATELNSQKQMKWNLANCTRNCDSFHRLMIMIVIMPCACNSKHDEPPTNYESDCDDFVSQLQCMPQTCDKQVQWTAQVAWSTAMMLQSVRAIVMILWSPKSNCIDSMSHASNCLSRESDCKDFADQKSDRNIP